MRTVRLAGAWRHRPRARHLTHDAVAACGDLMHEGTQACTVYIIVCQTMFYPQCAPDSVPGLIAAQRLDWHADIHLLSVNKCRDNTLSEGSGGVEDGCPRGAPIERAPSCASAVWRARVRDALPLRVVSALHRTPRPGSAQPRLWPAVEGAVILTRARTSLALVLVLFLVIKPDENRNTNHCIGVASLALVRGQIWGRESSRIGKVHTSRSRVQL